MFRSLTRRPHPAFRSFAGYAVHMWFLLACSSSPNIIGPARLQPGDAVLVCHRRAPAGTAAPYTCGPEIHAVAGPKGGDISGIELKQAVAAAGLSLEGGEVMAISLLPRHRPDDVAGSGMVLDPGIDGNEWFGAYVRERSDGRSVLYLSSP